VYPDDTMNEGLSHSTAKKSRHNPAEDLLVEVNLFILMSQIGTISKIF
jgi:hypothetical protein